jgi:hypothetical protein
MKELNAQQLQHVAGGATSVRAPVLTSGVTVIKLPGGGTTTSVRQTSSIYWAPTLAQILAVAILLGSLPPANPPQFG